MKGCSQLAVCFKYIIQDWHILSINKGEVTDVLYELRDEV